MTNLDHINWLEEVEKRQEGLLTDLFRLLKIRSVREDDKASEEAPVGPGPLKALEEFLAMAREDGFETKQFGPLVGRLEAGQGEEVLGILGHMDVVPEGTGWDTDPYEPVIKDGRIYARGSSDDKGPTVAAYFALKLLRELGAEFKQSIHLIVGTDEESGWQCMDHYAKVEKMPDYGFSPDAQFPIINGEKGNVSALISLAKGESKEGQAHLIKLEAGIRANMVPQDASAVVDFSNNDQAKMAFEAYLKDLPVSGKAQVEADGLHIELVGKAGHGSTPEVGENAGTYLANFLKNYVFDNQAAQDFLQLVGEILHIDFEGRRLGVAITDETMGALSMNVGIIRYDEEEGDFVDCNFRYPKGTDSDKIKGQIEKSLANLNLEITMSHAKEPHYVPADDHLVKTLLDVYHHQTGLEAHEKCIGGGTYGRLMKRGVAYGALFPDSIDTMHQANEFLALEDLLRATAIYAEAIYRLAC